ncbi:hypothetical protein B0H14DRAFT_2612554 [Mycena olivaceomarginata]|nr:hypothetical protein B0H14DRAFT_2612554 [Mycena olivaceomarginata]
MSRASQSHTVHYMNIHGGVGGKGGEGGEQGGGGGAGEGPSINYAVGTGNITIHRRSAVSATDHTMPNTRCPAHIWAPPLLGTPPLSLAGCQHTDDDHPQFPHWLTRLWCDTGVVACGTASRQLILPPSRPILAHLALDESPYCRVGPERLGRFGASAESVSNAIPTKASFLEITYPPAAIQCPPTVSEVSIAVSFPSTWASPVPAPNPSATNPSQNPCCHAIPERIGGADASAKSVFPTKRRTAESIGEFVPNGISDKRRRSTESMPNHLPTQK